MLRRFISDMAEGLKLMAEPRDAWYYYSRHLITASECLLLERLEQANGGKEC